MIVRTRRTWGREAESREWAGETRELHVPLIKRENGRHMEGRSKSSRSDQGIKDAGYRQVNEEGRQLKESV